MRGFVFMIAISLAGSVVSAQEAPSVETKRQAEELQKKTEMLVARPRVPLEKTVKNMPYSAELVIESSQTLADGNHINQKTTGRVYRDGEGRVRREEDRADGSVEISIVDPVSGVSYSLDSATRTAWKTPTETAEIIMKKAEAIRKEEELRKRSAGGEPAPDEILIQRKREAERAAAAVAAGRIQTGMNVEEHDQGPLEHKTMEGIPVIGRRTTTTIKAGAIGNDLPIKITSEEWTSTDLSILVMTRRNDPRSGESSYRLLNIVRAEPDSSLFQVPADYTVRDTGIRRNFVRR
jgi:hypothetical protein